jgi:predicted nucleic acid-binding protein
MPQELFVDSSAWLALADKSDKYHMAATSVYPDLLKRYQRLVTTNLVIAETHILLRRSLGAQPAIEFLERVAKSPRIEKAYSTMALEMDAEKILRQYADQEFSFTDAVSFALMQARRIKKAFAFDRHFTIAGFEQLPPL